MAVLEFLEKPEYQSKDDLAVVFVNDFNDEYHIEVDEADELYKKVRMIRRRYKETYEYQIAINLANIYFARLFEKYGGRKRFMKLFKAGLVRDYIPPYPRMKYHKRSMKLLDEGIMTTRRKFSKVNIDVLMHIDDAMQEYAPEEIHYADKDDAEVGKVNKMIDRGAMNPVTNNQARNMTLEAFEKFFLSRRDSNFSTDEDIVDEEFKTDITISDTTHPYYEEMVEDVSDNPNEYVTYSTGFVSKRDLEKVKTIERLSKAGWDPKRVARKMNGNKNILNITRDNKKKKKKSDKRKSAASSSLILGMAGADSNYNNYADYEQAMMKFTVNNLMD